MKLTVRKGQNPSRPWLVMHGQVVVGTHETWAGAWSSARRIAAAFPMPA